MSTLLPSGVLKKPVSVVRAKFGPPGAQGMAALAGADANSTPAITSADAASHRIVNGSQEPGPIQFLACGDIEVPPYGRARVPAAVKPS
ncbi:MAG: hypothetical protein ACRED3_09640 [Bradyrhizobium sp.]